jgi:peptidoglycan hydrolase CwlO-like protein
MAKGSRKSRKLDLIIAEIANLRSDIKRLVKQQTALAREVAKLARAEPARPSKKSARRPEHAAARPAKKAVKAVKAVRPVLVPSADTAGPAA